MKGRIYLACFITSLLSGYASTPEQPSHLSSQTDNSEQIHFHSQASQDEFVHTILYNLLNKQDQGYYLEIGAGDPIYINNSYILEKNLEWKGVSIDISEGLDTIWYNARKNPIRIEDAIRADYTFILKDFPQVIDYLSLDVDGYYDTVLKKIPFDKHTFKIITIEHDFYRYGDTFKNNERNILTALGYYLLCPDVSQNGLAFEDWWIHPSAFSPDTLSTLLSLDLNAKDCKEILQIIHTAL